MLATSLRSSSIRLGVGLNIFPMMMSRAPPARTSSRSPVSAMRTTERAPLPVGSCMSSTFGAKLAGTRRRTVPAQSAGFDGSRQRPGNLTEDSRIGAGKQHRDTAAIFRPQLHSRHIQSAARESCGEYCRYRGQQRPLQHRTGHQTDGQQRHDHDNSTGGRRTTPRASHHAHPADMLDPIAGNAISQPDERLIGDDHFSAVVIEDGPHAASILMRSAVDAADGDKPR